MSKKEYCLCTILPSWFWFILLRFGWGLVWFFCGPIGRMKTQYNLITSAVWLFFVCFGFFCGIILSKACVIKTQSCFRSHTWLFMLLFKAFFLSQTFYSQNRQRHPQFHIFGYTFYKNNRFSGFRICCNYFVASFCFWTRVGRW